MSKHILYSRRNALSIVVAAVLAYRNPGEELKESNTYKVPKHKLDEDRAFNTKSHLVDLIRDEHLKIEDNVKGLKIAVAIVSQHGDLSDANNLRFLVAANEGSQDNIKQLINEGDIIMKHHEFMDDYDFEMPDADTDHVDEVEVDIDNDEPKNEPKEAPKEEFKQEDPIIEDVNGPSGPDDDGKKVQMGSNDIPSNGPVQSETPQTVPNDNPSEDAPEQHMAPIEGSKLDGQKSTDLSNKTEPHVKPEAKAPANKAKGKKPSKK